MGTAQKWLAALAFLGAGYMVISNPDAFYKAAKGLQGLTSGSVTQITTGGKQGQLK
jgi:hypothetical protein